MLWDLRRSSLGRRFGLSRKIPPVGGSQPAGYVYVGSNQGLAVWGHADLVATSASAAVMEDGEAGNVQGM